jgi:hypothetical protein
LEGLASPVLNQLAMLHLLVFGNPRAAAETLLAIPGMDPGDGRLRELLTRIGETGTLRFLGLIGEGR